MENVLFSGVPEAERETEVESEEDPEVETGDAQRVEAGAGDPDPPVLATKARKLRTGNASPGCVCHAGGNCLPHSFSHSAIAPLFNNCQKCI